MTVIRVDKKIWLFIWWDWRKWLNQSSKTLCETTVKTVFNKRSIGMSNLDTLKLVAVKKPTHLPSVVMRRNKLANKVWEQIQLAKSQMDGTAFVVKKYRSYTDKETGLRKQVEMPKRIREWWFRNEAGKVCVAIKYGTRVLELAKGKHSIEVGNADELVKALEIVKHAVEVGELDTQIELASAGVKRGFKKS